MIIFFNFTGERRFEERRKEVRHLVKDGNSGKILGYLFEQPGQCWHGQGFGFSSGSFREDVDHLMRKRKKNLLQRCLGRIWSFSCGKIMNPEGKDIYLKSTNGPPEASAASLPFCIHLFRGKLTWKHCLHSGKERVALCFSISPIRQQRHSHWQACSLLEFS